MDFDGGWVGFGNPPGLQLSGPLTACAWIRVASPPPLAGGGRGYVVDKLFMPTTGGWRLAIGRAGPGGALGATVEISDPDGGFHETIGGSIALATWTHICAVFRGTSQSVYVSGLEAATGATPAGVITLTSDEVRIGIRGDGMQPFIGAVDDVRIYSRARSTPARSPRWRSRGVTDASPGRARALALVTTPEPPLSRIAASDIFGVRAGPP